MNPTGYDIIGDIHGCSQTLIALLEKLGYQNTDGIFQHPERKVIFLGDFIDRGPHQREVLDTVRPMVDTGAALSVMGNHEFNAIAWATQHPDTMTDLRPHNEKNFQQHQAFLAAYEPGSADYTEVIAWFKSLPLWLELDGLRVIHACWDSGLIATIRELLRGEACLSESLLLKACQKGSPEYEAIETLLKGKEIPLPDGQSFPDKDGNHRHHIRVRWWDQGAKTYCDAFMGPESALTHIPDDEIDGDHLVEYSHEEPPVFLGHYWMEGEPEPLAWNIACLDYSVAKPGGKLVAYRWDGEQRLAKDKFEWVERIEG